MIVFKQIEIKIKKGKASKIYCLIKMFSKIEEKKL